MYMDSFFWGGGFDILFFLILTVIIVVLMVGTVRGIGRRNKNNHSPRLSVTARITTKCTNMVRRQHANAGGTTGAYELHSSSSTGYYVIFEMAGGDRVELSMNDSEYGMLAEGDTRTLRFQGTRYLGFEKHNS